MSEFSKEQLSDLKKRAKAGDREALQILRKSGFFKKQQAKKGYLLSPGQRRLWVLQQMDGASAAYNVPNGVRLRGTLDTAVFTRALNTLTARHESLRAYFMPVENRPRQFSQAEAAFPLTVLDLRQESDPEAKAILLARQYANQPFDLQKFPLYAGYLMQTAAQEHIFFFNTHHIIGDAWSNEVLIQELAVLYQAFQQGKPSPLPPLSKQYHDYAAVQNRHLKSEAGQADRAYWLNQFSGSLPVLNLPTDYARPPLLTFDGEIASAVFDRQKTDALQALARQQGSSLFIALVAWVKLLLYRYTGQDDIIIGTPIAGRDKAEWQSQVGFFVNTLALRDEIDGSCGFQELLAAVRQTALEAYSHQQYPFDQLVDDLNLARDLSRNPLFDVVVHLQHLDSTEPAFSGIEIANFDANFTPAKFDLTFEFVEYEGELSLHLSYNTNLYGRARIERLLSHLDVLLDSLVAQPDLALNRLEILPAVELAQLMNWNDTAAAYPDEHTIPDLFADMAMRFSERVAITAGAQQVTYGELDQQARSIAAGLARLGVTAGDRVALFLPRDESMITAMLGVLYAGGVYVPLDPEYPADRLAHMVQHSGAKVVVKGERRKEKGERASFEWCGEIAEIVDYGVLVQAKGEPLQVAIDPDAPAYLLYTSGSTGKPKGVLVTHRNVVRLMHNTAHPFAFTEQDVWIVAHSFCFDFSVWEMYGALLYGGRVVVPERDVVRDTPLFLDLLKREQVSVLNQTPAAFYNLIGHEQGANQASLGSHLHTVIFGGDRLDPTYLRPWVARYPLSQVRLVNMYGITETTVHVTHYTLTEQDVWGEGGRSPIGVPIPETEVYILNEAQKLQPIGIPGEIYVGGSGVSAGYWRQEALTRARFVEIDAGDATLYRSGDLGCWSADGQLEHMGRNDFQVQLRGFRIELGEIENVLLSGDAIEKAVVIARGEDGDKRLLAYVIPQSAELKRYAQLEQSGALDGRKVTELPNGQMMAHLNQSETEFIFDEIVTHNSYLQHGVTVRDGDTVVDIGANIGMFSVFAAQQAADVRVIAFEPLPAAADCLRLNGRLHGVDLTVVQQGISDTAGEVSFNYYPFASVLSGQHAGTEDERETVRAFLKGKGEKEKGDGDDLLEELLDERLKVEVITAELVTLSEAIAESGVTRIDLLKIDVEKGERAVLSGIEAADWSKIDQVVMEVHDIDGALAWIETLLSEYRFRVTVDQDPALIGSDMYNVYGVKEGAREKVAPRQSEPVVIKRKSPTDFLDQLKRQVAENLPEYMMPSGFVLLDELPLTRNGKIDRKRLPEPIAGQGQGQVVGARNEVEEKLVAIWQEVLGVPEVGIHDDFFALGGHSLLATKAVARIQSECSAEVRLRDLFAEPTVAQIAELVGQRQTAVIHIEPIAEAAHYPASHAQRRLWVIENMGVGRAAYNISSAMWLDRKTDLDSLEQALRVLVERHEAMRTTFGEIDGELRQIVLDAVSWEIEQVDMGGHTAESLRARVEAEGGRPFDLTASPLFRFTLLATDERPLLLFSIHHIISDGWSLELLLDELSQLLAGRELTPLTIQYKDYAAWQASFLMEEGENLRTFWRETLSGEIPLLDLPTDRPRPSVQTFAGATYDMTWGKAESQAFLRLGQEINATPFMTVLALVNGLFYRYTGQEDIILGYPTAGRDHPDLMSQVGFYVNMLPLRQKIQGSESLMTLLGGVQKTVTAAFDHQMYPFDLLVEELNLRRDMGRSPLFDVAVSMQTAGHAQQQQAQTLPLEGYEIEAGISKWDMLFWFNLLDDGRLHLSIEYSTDLFAADRIQRLATHLHRLAQSVIETPHLPLAQLTLLPAAERNHIAMFNRTARDYPAEQTLIARFAEQVSRWPDKTAVIFEDKTLTYRQLNELANRLAHTLRDRYGVQAEEPVGVLLDRSEWTAVTLLGVLKAGGAYLPIDPAYPAARIDYIVDDTNCRLILSEPKYLDRQAGTADVTQLLSDKTEELPPIGSGESLAYIIYTSGSTGQPKGSLIEQRSVSRLVINTNYISLDENSRILQTGSLAFDASTFEIWGALLNGGTLCLPGGKALLDATKLADLIGHYRATTLFLTTSLFNQIVEADVMTFAGLDTVLSGGEKVSVGHFQQLREALPDVTLLHVYGPTENTTFSTYYPVNEIDGWDIPIGYPIANSTVHILDAQGRPVPIGIPGEICVGGDGVARGYLNRPDLTDERFVGRTERNKGNDLERSQIDMTGDEQAQSKIYKTGDLGLWLADGSVKFVGRIDNQLKIRGFRVEPGEIEQCLLSFAAIQETAVLPRTTSVGTKELLAYVVGERPLTVQEIKHYLSDKLPEYMVPAHFVQLPEFPLNQNGKIDRQALPEPELYGLSDGRDYTAPRDEREAVLAAVLQDVLGLPQIGIHDNYFEIGGDSIRAIQITSRLLQRGWKLEIQDLFALPTIAELGPMLQSAVDANDNLERVTGATRLTPIQRWFFAQHAGHESNWHHFNQAILLRSAGPVDEDALKSGLAAILEHHDLLRATYTADLSQQIAAEVDVILDVMPCGSAEELAEKIDEAHQQFDLTTGPLFRAALLKTADDGDRLLLVAHHLVVDGVSWRILFEDLERAYQQAINGEAVNLGGKTTSFQDWGDEIGIYLEGQPFREAATYWEEQIEIAIPLSQPASANNIYGVTDTVSFTLSEAETAALLTETHHAYHTEINDLLLVALARALETWQGGQETLITLEGHGRDGLSEAEVDVSRTVGWFTTMYPYLLTIPEFEIGEQIKGVKERLRETMRHSFAYGALRYWAGMTGDIGPLLSFNYLGQFDSTAEENGFFRFADESSGQPIDPQLPREHQLDIVGVVAAGQMSLSITFNAQQYNRTEIEAFWQAYQDALLDVTEHCQIQQDGEMTASDYTADLSSDDLSAILDIWDD